MNKMNDPRKGPGERESSANSPGPARQDEKQSSGSSAPAAYGDDQLLKHLAQLKLSVRRYMRRFDISSDRISVMARKAESSIADTAARDTFLRLLADLHECGQEAKRRGLLSRPAENDATEPTTRPDVDRGTKLFAPTDGASDEVSDDASRDFFAGLDR
jgi:hypothetical protein